MLRTVGCGIAQLEPETEQVRAGLSWSFASNEPQEVGRGELEAFRYALALTEHNLLYLPDCDAVTDGYRARVWERLEGEAVDTGKLSKDTDDWFLI